VLSCFSLIACAPLAYAAFQTFPRSRRLLAATGISLNPVAIWSCAEGHNDVIVLAIVLAGFAIAARSRTFAGTLTIALAALVKVPALVACAAFAVHTLKQPRQRVRVLYGAGLGALIVIGVATPLEYGVGVHLAPSGFYFPQFSPQYALAAILPVPVAAASVFALCGVLGLAGTRALYLGRADGAILIAFAAWFAIPNPYPWYALWILPVAFLARSRAASATWAVIAATLLIVLRYYGDATTELSTGLSLAIVALSFGLPIAMLMGGRMFHVRPDRPEIHTPVPGFARTRNS
jgi:hypothetical protein